VSPDRSVGWIHRATTVGVVGLAVAGFAMSYGALHGLALEEAVPARLAWLWPLVVDGFIVVASLAVLHAVLERRSTAYPWCLVLGFSAVSVSFNVVHAAPTTVARLVLDQACRLTWIGGGEAERPYLCWSSRGSDRNRCPTRKRPFR